MKYFDFIFIVYVVRNELLHVPMKGSPQGYNYHNYDKCVWTSSTSLFLSAIVHLQIHQFIDIDWSCSYCKTFRSFGPKQWCLLPLASKLVSTLYRLPESTLDCNDKPTGYPHVRMQPLFCAWSCMSSPFLVLMRIRLESWQRKICLVLYWLISTWGADWYRRSSVQSSSSMAHISFELTSTGVLTGLHSSIPNFFM